MPGNISVNGGREASNAFLVNGGDVSEGRNMGTAIVPNIDSVAEFRLITHSFDAEYGRFSGAVMNAITKSGTNGFHGTAFEFVRNDDFDSRNYFDPAKGAFKRNQFGYAVGGPGIKNKLFWFTDYQGTREVRGISTGLLQIPSVAQRSGNFGATAFQDNAGNPTTVNGPYWAQMLSSRLGYTVTNGEPYSGRTCVSTADCVFPGGVIPSRAFRSHNQPAAQVHSTAQQRSEYSDVIRIESEHAGRQGRSARRFSQQEDRQLVHVLHLRRLHRRNPVFAG